MRRTPRWRKSDIASAPTSRFSRHQLGSFITSHASTAGWSLSPSGPGIPRSGASVASKNRSIAGSSPRSGSPRTSSAKPRFRFPSFVRSSGKKSSKLVSEGISAKELSFIKKFLARSYAFEVDTASKRVHQALDVDLLGLPGDYYTKHVEAIEGVTLEATQAALRDRIDPSSLLVVVVGTASEILKDVEKAIPNLEKTEVVPFDSL